MSNNLTNGSLEMFSRLRVAVPLVAFALVFLFVFVQPEATRGYSFMERTVFWTVHVGIGLMALLAISYVVARSALRELPPLFAVLISGLIGAAILAPVYLGLEQLIPERLHQPPDDVLDYFAARGPLAAVTAQFLESAPMFLLAWIVINLPLLFDGASKRNPVGAPNNRPPTRDPDPNVRATSGDATVHQLALPSRTATGSPTQAMSSPDPPADASSLLAKLPLSLGTDIVCISSDLHYLHVHTSMGRCMLLGSLKAAATELGDRGMQVHRSHWVAFEHVERVIRDGRHLTCLIKNGDKVPVSRRNQAEVMRWYGKEARLDGGVDSSVKERKWG